MTRGTIFCLCNDLIIESIEFNGDLYPSHYGQDVIKFLEQIETANEFRLAVEKFNKEAHNYTDYDLTFPRKKSFYMKDDNIIKMTKANYFKKFGSDWTFFKNISDNTIIIRTTERKSIELKPMEQVAINFGHYEGNYRSSEECAEIIRKEEEERERRKQVA